MKLEQSEQAASIVQQCVAFLNKPQILVALTVMMIPVTIAATEVIFLTIDFVLMFLLACGATNALIAEIKK